MKLQGIMISVMLLAGCQQAPPFENPFLGRTTVPPPGTGNVGQAAPYYPAVPAAPPSATPGPGTPYVPPASPYQPPGGLNSVPAAPPFVPGQSSLEGGRSVPDGLAERGIAAAPGREVNSASGDQSAQASTASSRGSASRGIRVVSRDGRLPAGPAEPRYLAESRVDEKPALTDMADLPRPSAVVRRASFSESGRSAGEGDSSSTRRRSRSRGDYDYQRDYSALSGKLEYSVHDRRWKLRYIPVDGETDDFGGSVVLTDRAALDDFQAGDFVTVTGRIDDAGAAEGGFAPLYQVDDIRRQEQ